MCESIRPAANQLSQPWFPRTARTAQGISGFVFLKSLLLGLHAVLALALSAALGVFHTELYMLLVDR